MSQFGVCDFVTLSLYQKNILNLFSTFLYMYSLNTSLQYLSIPAKHSLLVTLYVLIFLQQSPVGAPFRTLHGWGNFGSFLQGGEVHTCCFCSFLPVFASELSPGKNKHLKALLVHYSLCYPHSTYSR